MRFDQSDASTRASAAGERVGSVARTRTTTTKLSAFAQNATARPPAEIARPAIDGPTIRPRLNCAELRAIALPIAWRSTIVDTTAWNAGVPNAPADPASAAMTTTCQNWTVPEAVRIAS